jgi:hypothetical protein
MSEAKGAEHAAKGTSLVQGITHTDYHAETKHPEIRRRQSNGKRTDQDSFPALSSDEKVEIGLRKASSTSTLYVQSTIYMPDVDRILFSMGMLLEQMMEDPPKGTWHLDLFNPPPRLNSKRVSKRSAGRCSAKDIYRFLKDLFEFGKWSSECNIIALVLITRLVTWTEVTLNRNNWDKILLCSLLLAQKIWDDFHLGNNNFPLLWQIVYPDEVIDLAVVNRMEKLFLCLLSYDVHVSRTVYTRFYFELRDLSEDELPLRPLSEQAGQQLELKGAKRQEVLLTQKDRCAAQLGDGSASVDVLGERAHRGIMVFS